MITLLMLRAGAVCDSSKDIAYGRPMCGEQGKLASRKITRLKRLVRQYEYLSGLSDEQRKIQRFPSANQQASHTFMRSTYRSHVTSIHVFRIVSALLPGARHFPGTASETREADVSQFRMVFDFKIVAVIHESSVWGEINGHFGNVGGRLEQKICAREQQHVDNDIDSLHIRVAAVRKERVFRAPRGVSPDNLAGKVLRAPVSDLAHPARVVRRHEDAPATSVRTQPLGEKRIILTWSNLDPPYFVGAATVRSEYAVPPQPPFHPEVISDSGNLRLDA
eukprot:810150-Pleurochrysis_carterae.AAC.2